ncbi:hypothetical protein Gotur_019457 [Gossypium turneri]
MSHETRNTFLVVTVLIITSTYGACLNPPKMPDDSPCPSLKYQVSLSQDQPLNSHTFLHKTDMNTAPMPSPFAMDVSEKVDLISASSAFWLFNSCTFCLAMFLITFLLLPHPFSALILITLYLFGLSYLSLFDVSSWSFSQLYEISNETALRGYRVADSVNNFFASVIHLIVPCQVFLYFARDSMSG